MIGMVTVIVNEEWGLVYVYSHDSAGLEERNIESVENIITIILSI